MADKIRDAEDEMLAALFRSEPIADDGFSDRVVRRIRRRLWLRRLALPTAAAIGAAIALKPLASLATSLAGFVRDLPLAGEMTAAVAAWMPSLPMLIAGGMLLAVMLAGLRLLDE